MIEITNHLAYVSVNMNSLLKSSPNHPVYTNWIKISHQRILDHFYTSRSWERFEEYCALHENTILRHELPILVWLDWVYRDSQKTIRLYARYTVDFLNFVRTDYDQVREYDVKAFLNHLTMTGMKPSSRNTVLAALKSLFTFLAARQFIPASPTVLIRKARTQAVRKSHTFGQEELRKLWAYMREHAPGRDHAMLKTLYYCGLRREELVGLTWNDLHRWQDAWHLRVVGKGNKERSVYVPSMALQTIWEYREITFMLRPETPAPQIRDWPLFSNKRRVSSGISPDSVYKTVKKYVSLALEISASPHWFRHTFCTHLALLGEPVERIKVAAGHESIETTMQYIDIANSRKAAGMAFDCQTTPHFAPSNIDDKFDTLLGKYHTKI